jgi:glyoxylase-like metal-dependent hydrolase (beta-lactamase superfamily II)
MTDRELTNKGIMYADSGFHIIRQMMPYPLAETNVFLSDTSDGWAVIDVGVDIQSTRDVWQQAIKEVGISFKQINKIFITHCHPDHLGAARWLQQCCEAPVYMLREEISRSKKYIFLDQADFKNLYRQSIVQEITENKFPEDKFEELIEDWYKDVRPLYIEPDMILPVDIGDKIDLNGNSFEIMSASGHSDGQVMFWSGQLKQLFSADILTANGYLHFTDWPNTSLQNPLGNLFALLQQLISMGVERTFPGHGPVITDLNYEINKLLDKHHKNLNKIELAVTSLITAGELYPRLFKLPDYVHAHRVTIGEVIGYLNYLVNEGRLLLSTDEKGCNLYRPV